MKPINVEQVNLVIECKSDRAKMRLEELLNKTGWCHITNDFDHSVSIPLEDDLKIAATQLIGLGLGLLTGDDTKAGILTTSFENTPHNAGANPNDY